MNSKNSPYPLAPFLEDLDSRMNQEHEACLHDQWVTFLEGKCPAEIFHPGRQPAPASRVEWPSISVNETMDDIERMVLSQLKASSDLISSTSGNLPCARGNYGVGIMPCLFGAGLFMMPCEMNEKPNSLPIGPDGIRALLDKGIPDLRGGLGGRVLDMGARWVEQLAPYPKLKAWIPLYHPDMQGPMDICELLWGSGIFYELVDQPGLVHQALKLITETYIAFMREWWKIAPPNPVYNSHWGLLHKGNIMLRDDSAMNLGPEMYREFIFPYNQQCLRSLGGGALHACGRVDHWASIASELEGLTAFNFSQPQLNDMEVVYQTTIDRGIPLLKLDPAEIARATTQGRRLHGLVHRS